MGWWPTTLGAVLEDRRESLEKTDAPGSIEDPVRLPLAVAGKGRRPKWEAVCVPVAGMPEVAGSRGLRLAPRTVVKSRDERIFTAPSRRHACARRVPLLVAAREGGRRRFLRFACPVSYCCCPPDKMPQGEPRCTNATWQLL